MTKRKKIALCMAILLAALLLFSHLFVIAEADHDCSGEGCPVCEVIAIVTDILQKLVLICAAIMICAAAASGTLTSRHAKSIVRFASSPITLKVKLSN